MSVFAPSLDPAVLRPKVRESIEHLRDEELLTVHRLLLEIEAKRLMTELGNAFHADWASGAVTEQNLQEAVSEHRQKHPYR